jgi:AGZA family xanthine/uracil permease-like MFS transporter
VKRFVRGDLDGFFALGLDNMVMLILMSNLCQGFLGFSSELFFGKILPATAVGLAIGNVYYWRQALSLAEREHRQDVCALPYGTSILTVIAFVFLAMFPAQQLALADGLSKEEADLIAWRAGLLACFGSGLIEFFGSFIVYRLRDFTPRAALLSTLAGIGFAFISLDFVFRSYAFPLIGITTLGLTIIIYYGGVRLKFGLPAGFVALLIGTAIAWVLVFAGEPSVVADAPLQINHLGIYVPIPLFNDLWAAFEMAPRLIPVLAPLGIIHLVLSLQIIESADAAGDRFPARSSLAINGVGTLAASLFGSPFPTSLYIGHPGWKALGARAGYSLLNAIFIGAVCLSGTASIIFYFIPVEAGIAILIWIGVSMMSQAFETTPKKHIPAAVFGIIPVVGAYGALILKHGLATAGTVAETSFFNEATLSVMEASRTFFGTGAFAIEQGYVYTSIILSAATVFIIEKRFRQAALWFLAGAVGSATGLMHQYELTFADSVSRLDLEFNQWFWSYLTIFALLWVIPYLTVDAESERHS